ncbi:hypothetical protein ACFLWG_02995 [Chloroflexota bacterium]
MKPQTIQQAMGNNKSADAVSPLDELASAKATRFMEKYCIRQLSTICVASCSNMNNPLD